MLDILIFRVRLSGAPCGTSGLLLLPTAKAAYGLHSGVIGCLQGSFWPCPVHVFVPVPERARECDVSCARSTKCPHPSSRRMHRCPYQDRFARAHLRACGSLLYCLARHDALERGGFLDCDGTRHRPRVHDRRCNARRSGPRSTDYLSGGSASPATRNEARGSAIGIISSMPSRGTSGVQSPSSWPAMG